MDKSILAKIDQFVQKDSEREKIIVILGPTACGKTALSIDVATHLGSEILSVDARQIYQDMTIGTGKILPHEMNAIPHHLIDICRPDEIFSVVEFRELGEPIIYWLHADGKIPILCWGTGLYIDSLIFERSFPSTEPNWTLREELEEKRQKEGNIALWNMLHEIDPRYAETLHVNNYRYIMRGIEVFLESGKSKLDIQDTPTPLYDTLFLTPYDGDRTTLYARIDKRVEWMFSAGLVEENISLRERYGIDAPGLKTIGYKELAEYFAGDIPLERAIALVQQHSRNYAKRQITWNKKYETFFE